MKADNTKRKHNMARGCLTDVAYVRLTDNHMVVQDRNEGLILGSVSANVVFFCFNVRWNFH